MKNIVKQLTPPVLWEAFYQLKQMTSAPDSSVKDVNPENTNPSSQDLDLYWDPAMADLLDNWGKDHVWNEIEMFLIGKSGKILDIACGTGITMEILSKQQGLQLYGCDISDFLIRKAVEKGIANQYLQVCDATNMKVYMDNEFDYSFSIGSLEHFTEEGILKFVSEVHRTTEGTSFHMMPVSRSGINEGWIKPLQSYHNNSVDWWIEKFRTNYANVYVINSGWKDKISAGKWFVCTK